MKAKDVRGFMIEKESIGIPWGIANTVAGNGYVNGNNKAIDAQGEREITLNREKLAKVLLAGYEDVYSKIVVARMVDAIIVAEADILESPTKE